MSAATSFRDPAGFCFDLEGRILRVVAPPCVAQVEAFLNSACGRKFAEAGALVSSRLLPKAEVAQLLKCESFNSALAGRAIGAVFEHDRIEFPSFAHEWSPAMLYAAADLTLDLAIDALASGYTLKDAAPRNVLFRGPKPVFVDLLSFEPRVRGEAMWKPYAQFVRCFLLPLLANKYWGNPLVDIFATRRDGLESSELYRRCTLLQKLRTPFLNLVTLPTVLARKADDERIYQTAPLADEEKASFIVAALLRRLRKTLQRLKPVARAKSTWSLYMAEHSCEANAFAVKDAFVGAALEAFKPAKVLDIGANTGHFSRCAVRAGARVVAIDADAVCAAESFTTARAENLDLLSLVIDIARPSAALGWRNRECASFLDRARGQFDAVLMLAIAHHLLVTDRVPLPEIINLAAELTRSLLLIEFVPVSDPMFQRLLRGRGALFAQYDRQSFERACETHFSVVRTADLPGTQRRLYLLRKKA